MLEADLKTVPIARSYHPWEPWNRQSLAMQFLLAGGLVSLLAMAVIGLLVKSQIEGGVTRNSAAATALYVDSIIAPLLPDMQTSQALDESTAHALDETLAQGALGDQLLSFRLWRPDGTILYANDPELIGKRFGLNKNLRAAFQGQLVAEFNQLDDDPESEKERESGEPLLEIYNPVRQPWSGEVVAVSEFYEVAPDLARDLRQAAIRSWLAVAGGTLFFFLILSAIVLRGSRTIDAQSQALSERVAELSDLLEQNRALQLKVTRAAQGAAAVNERYLRRIGADLHDGPAQLIALAALRLDGPVLSDDAASFDKRQREALAIKASLDDALEEIRSICSGLVLPHIEAADLPEILAMAVRHHEQRTGNVNQHTGYRTDMTQSIQVVVIDDHPLFREGVARSLTEIGGFEVVGEGSTAEDAVRLTREKSPDIILLDISMPGGGLNAIAPILGHRPSQKIVLLTASEDRLATGWEIAAPTFSWTRSTF